MWRIPQRKLYIMCWNYDWGVINNCFTKFNNHKIVFRPGNVLEFIREHLRFKIWGGGPETCTARFGLAAVEYHASRNWKWMCSCNSFNICMILLRTDIAFWHSEWFLRHNQQVWLAFQLRLDTLHIEGEELDVWILTYWKRMCRGRSR